MNPSTCSSTHHTVCGSVQNQEASAHILRNHTKLSRDRMGSEWQSDLEADWFLWAPACCTLNQLSYLKLLRLDVNVHQMLEGFQGIIVLNGSFENLLKSLLCPKGVLHVQHSTPYRQLFLFLSEEIHQQMKQFAAHDLHTVKEHLAIIPCS